MLNSQTGYPQIMTHSPNTNPITQPAHYTAGRLIEPLEVIESWGLNYHFGNILKYIARAGRKDCEVTDLEKALFYLDRAIRNCPSAKAENYFKKDTLSVEKVAKDWRLNTSLELAIMHLHDATNTTPTFHIEAAQKQINIRLTQLKVAATQDAANENTATLEEGKAK